MLKLELGKALKYINLAQNQFSKWDSAVDVGDRYYDNDNDIMRTGAAAIDAVNGYLKNIGQNPLRSADNRISCNWHEILTVQKNAYLFTYPPVITVAGDEKLSKEINEMLGDNYAKTLIRLGTYATNAGTSWLQYWIDANGEFKTTEHKANECAAFTDPMDINRTKIALVRRYTLLNEEGDETEHYEVWDPKEVVFVNGETNEFEKVIMGGKEVDRMTNPFGKIPFIEFPNNERKSSDLNKYKALIDSFNKIVSGFANDLDDIQEIILVLKDFNGEKENEIFVPQKDAEGNIMYDEDGEPILRSVKKSVNLLQQIKAKKYLTVEGNGGVDKLTLDIPTEAREAALKFLQKQIYIAGMGVDPNPERTGQATGAYVDHMYHLLELKAGMMETEFRSALNELIRAMLDFLGKGKNLKITQSWTRNKPKDANDTVQRLSATPTEVMSNYTKRRLHPDIDDPDLEDKLVEKELEEARNNMFDSFEEPQEESEEE